VISVKIQSKLGKVQSFVIKSHGSSYVCGAVSFLTLNTVNCIEAFTTESFTCDYNPDGGFLNWKREGNSAEVDLLLNTMVFGLNSIKENYGKEIRIEVEDYD